MDPTSKPSSVRKLLVRVLLLGVFVLLLRFVYVVAVHGGACDSGDFCLFSSPSDLPVDGAAAFVRVVGGGGGRGGAAASTPALRALWTSREWRKAVEYYSAVFQDLLAEGFLSPASRSLCVDAPAGYEVLALREIGVPDAVGVAKKKAPPLVVAGDLLRQPFAAGEFDFVFAGLSLDRSKRPADLKAEIARTTKPEGLIVVHTASAADLYLAEVSPPRWRGAFTTGFQFFLLVRVVVASITNYFTARLRWGWRLSVGLAAVPSAILLLGALFIPDTPSSLIHRGMPDAARSALRRLRGPAADVDAELKDVARAVEDGRLNEQGAFARILLQRRYGPYLVMSFAIPLFQQFTGVIVLAFFSPILFQTVGFGSNAALMGAVILAAVDLVAILVSTFTIDRYGRKVLLIVGGVQMIVSLITVSWIMGSKMGGNGQATMAKPYATAVVVLLCLFFSKRHQFLLSKLSVFNPP